MLLRTPHSCMKLSHAISETPHLAQGEAVYLFSLVYTSLDDILGRIQELRTISRKDDTKAGRLEAKKLLAVIIQVGMGIRGRG